MLAGSNVALLTFGHLSAPNLVVSLSQDEAIPNQPPASSNEPLSTPQFSVPSQPDVQVVLHVTYTCSLHQQAFNLHAFIQCSWRIVGNVALILLQERADCDWLSDILCLYPRWSASLRWRESNCCVSFVRALQALAARRQRQAPQGPLLHSCPPPLPLKTPRRQKKNRGNR